MSVRILQVDAFTSVPFRGNPAAVCLLEEPAEEEWMQNVAAEMNLSETAFVVARGDGEFNLRWFTPAAEVDLCGHATLGSSHALWDDGVLPRNVEARFHTASGLLTCVCEGDWIEMDFPAIVPVECEPPTGLLEGLGVKALFVGRDHTDYFVEVADESVVRGMKPDFVKLEALGNRGVVVTGAPAAGSQFDFVSRFFAPCVGVMEDPVTGSAHCRLAPYWMKKLGRNRMTGFQASARGGVVRVRVAGDRVKLGGQAVTVLRGHLC